MYRLFFGKDIKLKRKYWIFLILLIFCDSIGVFTPILLGKIVDLGLEQKNLQLLLFWGILTILFVILRILGAYMSVIRLDLTTMKIRNKRKVEMYDQIQKSDHKFFEKNSVGELLNLISEDWQNVRRWFTFNIKTIVYCFAHFLIALIFFFLTSIPFTFIILGFILVQFLVSFHFSKKTKLYYWNLRERDAKLAHQVQDFIDGNRVLRSLNVLNQEADFLKRENIKNQEYNLELQEKRIKYSSFISLSNNLFTIIFLIGITYLFIKGMITVGEIIILRGLTGYLAEPFARASEMLQDYQKAKTSETKLKNVLNYKNSILSQGTMIPNNLLYPIEFQNVCACIDNRIVLKNLNFTIEPYQTVAFIGMTGSGKSSIANLLECFLSIREGSIQIGNQDIYNYDLKEYRSHIGYVFQEPFLFSDTIRNNISYGKELSESELERITKVCALDFVLKLPHQFDTVIGEKGVGLSGGEKQRIALARELAKRPDILILDDMTSALDINTEKRITDAIYKLDYPCTKIIIAEKIVSVKNADKIYVLDDGSIIESGTHESLLKEEGYYYQIYQIQKGAKL